MTGIDSSFVPPELNENKPENLEENRKIAFENSKRIHEQNKVYYDENSNPIHYKKGDMVYIKNGSHIGRKKLEPVRVGPFRIKKKLSDLIFVIDSGFQKKESNIFHASKMVPYLPIPASYDSS
ncbi:hypothetical protein HHI36_015249 [Cryptolaemus montrouzieri]|uniref:Uncharacterized protein n=1 Tax=Cryptolaemus montrouzieri TaxID=559131 RepID=A0ABD2N6H6_9CUCU